MIGNAFSILRNRGFIALVRALAWLAVATFHRRVRGGRYLKKRIHGRPMHLDLEDRGISRTLVLFGTRELEHLWILRRALHPGMHVLDVGANIGYYALIELDLVGPDGRLTAVEPSPSNTELLQRNLELNGHEDVTVHQAAVSDTAGSATFHLSAMSNLGTFHPVGTGAGHVSGETLQVRTMTVPEIVGEERVDLLRMDVEGHEVEVLTGLLPAIEAGTQAPMILFETHFTRYSESHDIANVIRKLAAFGYGARYVASSSRSGTRTIEMLGYVPVAHLKTDDVKRAIFETVETEDLIELLTVTGGARAILLTPPGEQP